MTATASDTSGWNAAPSNCWGSTSVVIAPAVKPAGSRRMIAGIRRRLASTCEPNASATMRPTPSWTWLVVTDPSSCRRSSPSAARSASARAAAGRTCEIAGAARGQPSPPRTGRSRGYAGRMTGRARPGPDRSRPDRARFAGGHAESVGAWSRRHGHPAKAWPPPPAGVSRTARPAPGTATGPDHPAGVRSGRPRTRMIGGYDEYRSRPGAVRVYLDQPLLFRADHDRAGLPDRAAADRVVPQQAGGVPAADPVLRHAAGHQRGNWRSYRHRAGVRVRDELGGLLPAGRQRLRRAAGDGGAGRVLPGVRIPGTVAVRLGQAAPPDPPADHLGGLARQRAVRGVHHGGELLDAAPGRLPDGQRETAAE